MPGTSRLLSLAVHVDNSSKRCKLITALTSHTAFILVKGARIGHAGEIAPAADGARRQEVVQEEAVTQAVEVTEVGGLEPGPASHQTRCDLQGAATTEKI